MTPVPEQLTPEQRRQRGTPARHPGLPSATVTRATRRPRPPADLGPAGTVAWRRAWLAPWLTKHDTSHVELLARVSDWRQQLVDQIKADGATTRGARGQLAAHPLTREVRNASAELERLLTLLGFNPLGRKRLAIATVDPDRPKDAFDQLLDGRAARRGATPPKDTA